MSAITTFHKDLIVVDQTQLENMTQGELVELAKENNGKAIKAAKQTLIHAGQTGIVLIALKAKIPHGQFLKCVETLTEIPSRTAQTYMSIATKYATVAHLRGVRDAIRYIRESSSTAKRLAAYEDPIKTLPAPRPSTGAVIIDAEIVEPLTEKETARPAELEAIIENGIRDCPEMFDDADDIEPLVVDESKTEPAPKEKNPIIKYGVSVINKTKDVPIDPTEPLFIAIKNGNPEAKTEPIFDAIEHLIFVLIFYKSTAGYIDALADAVLTTEGKTP